MNNIKVSIIIPIYLVEQYLKECVESVRRQSYKNIEIILVNDGSPDKSPQICDDLAKQDSRITVIHKTNGGLSDARNAGICASTGHYILFLDGDDLWDDETALARLIERVKITKPDVLNFSYKKYFEDTDEKIPYFSGIKNMPKNLRDKTKQLDFLTKHGLYIASACNKLIRKNILDERMRFQKEIYSEDIEWCARLLVYAKSMDFVCENFYCYRQRKNSITHTISKKKCDDLCSNVLKCINDIDLVERKEKKYIKRYIAYQYGTFFKVQAQSQENPLESVQALSKYKWILFYHCGNKKLISLYVSSYILGYKNTCKLIRYIYGEQRKRGIKSV